MKTMFTKFFRERSVIFLVFMLSCTAIIAQNVPEYMYFKFDAPGNQTNFASAPVGNNPATLTGMTIGGTGQFGTGMMGDGIYLDGVNTGWATNLPASGFTISMWLNNLPSDANLYYLWGDVNAASFRCFLNGAAGAGNVLFRRTGWTDVLVTGVAPGPMVLTFVYTGTSVDYYKNGVFAGSVAEANAAVAGAGPFYVGTYNAAGYGGVPVGSIMDEYRMYNRALSAAEITATWNQPLPLSGPPSCVTTAATLITGTTATLNGTVNANASSTTVTFEYGLTVAYGNTVPGVPSPVTGNTVTPVSAAITGLTPNTLYHFRVNGVNANGTTNGNDMTFTTAPPPPTVVTTAATGIGLNTATLNGTVNANSASTTVTFQYGLTVAYGTTVPGVPSPVTGNTVTPVSAAIAGLTVNTLYHYRVVGVNTGGTSNGNDMTFMTAGPPIVTTDLPTSIGNTTATVNGTVNANNASSTVTFQYGLTVAYGTIVPGVPSPVAGSTPTAVSANLSGLTIYTTYHYRCVATNAVGTTNGNDQTFYTGCVAPAQPSSLTGPTSVCQGGSGYVYTCAAVPGATSYTWTLPGGGSITGGIGTTSITVSFALGAIPGFVTAAATGSCGTGPAASLGVVPYPPPTPTITGPATTCQETYAVYTTQNGMSNYTWGVSAGGTITGGAGTCQITVHWTGSGALTVSVNYANMNGCLAINPTVYNVTVNTQASPTITGANNVCVNSGNYTYTTQSGMTAYVWTVSSGGTLNSGQGTNAISVTWTGSGTQTVSVNYNNANGCSAPSPTVYPVTINPIPSAAGPISGTSGLCAPVSGISYFVAPVGGATAYVWTLPVGASIGTGAGTNNITVNFGTNAVSGNITVYGTNLCGAGGTSPNYPVTVYLFPVAAGTITGPATVCTPATGLVYTVPIITNATGYVWTIPPGAMIVAGDNTNSITVNFPVGATSGNFSVYGTNNCGNGTPSADYAVTVAPKPPAPTITQSGDTLISDAATGNQWYKNNTLLPGATGQTYIPTQTAHYTVVVTLNGCSSVPSNDIYFLMTGIDALGQNGTLSVFPNPNDGLFTLVVSTKELQVFDLKVINNLGISIYESKDIRVQGSFTKTIDLRNSPDGVYSIILLNSNAHILKKIVINK